MFRVFSRLHPDIRLPGFPKKGPLLTVSHFSGSPALFKGFRIYKTADARSYLTRPRSENCMSQVSSNGDTSMVHHGTKQTSPLRACLWEVHISRAVIASQIPFDCLLCVNFFRKPLKKQRANSQRSYPVYPPPARRRLTGQA